jgi:Laminin G domain.
MRQLYTILFACLSILFSACESDNESFPNQPVLEQAIENAEELIETTVEGLEEGDYPPGSQARLQLQIDWAKYILSTSDNDNAFANASEKILSEIEYYKTNLVKGGYPVYNNGSYFNLGKLSDYNIYEQFTIECKVRFKDFGSSLGNIIAAESGGGIILRNNGSKIDAYINDGGWLGGSANVDLELNKWHHLAFTYSGSQVNLYIDGVAVVTATGSKKQVVANAAVNLHIGANPSYASRYMRGNVAYVSIWNYPRTEAQIQSDLDPSFSGTEEGLLAYWPFDVNLGFTILDKTGKRTAVGTAVDWEDK